MSQAYGKVIDFDKSVDVSRLRDCNVLITGGASGIGGGAATQFAADGANVIIADANVQLGQELEANLTAQGLNAKFIEVDVSSRKSQAALFRDALNWFTRPSIDILITSAGVSCLPGDIAPEDASGLDAIAESSEPEHGSRTISINLVGTIYSIQLALKYAMGLGTASATEKKKKAVVCISSLAAYAVTPAFEYTCSKWGVRGMLRYLRKPASALGVRLNMLVPSLVETPLTAARIGDFKAAGLKAASIDDAVAGILRICTDGDIAGRAVAVLHDGLYDVGDDYEGKYGFAFMDGVVRRDLDVFITGKGSDEVPSW